MLVPQHHGVSPRKPGRPTAPPALTDRASISTCTPSNAVLTVVGDIRLEQVKALVESHFGDIPARPVAPGPALAPIVLHRMARRESGSSVAARREKAIQ